MDQSIEFSLDIIRRYNKSGPRYTSYPTAVQFHSGFSIENYLTKASHSNQIEPQRPLSLYFHIPFCNTVCFYCGCNKIVTKHRDRAAPYLQRLHKEISIQGKLFDKTRKVAQLHWGGGTPTFISHAEMQALMEFTREHFSLYDDDQGEYSIEIDPREVQSGTIPLLRKLGFNRMSLGVQDFDPKVQKAVNRIQSEQLTLSILTEARQHGFQSINMDLIYGLPLQTVTSFGHTIEQIIHADPDRISVFNYAHLPERFKPQRRIKAEDLPSPAEKLAILQMIIDQLSSAGYIYIGMDHFAKPNDPLAMAQRTGNLYRNFQGYSTHANCDLIAMGITSISMVDDCFAQNVRDLESYYHALDHDQLAIYQGFQLDRDDTIRRAVIMELICHFKFQISAIEKQHDINFQDYFAWELEQLIMMQQDGLLRVRADTISVLPVGRLLIRNICMVFDISLRGSEKHRFSRVI